MMMMFIYSGTTNVTHMCKSMLSMDASSHRNQQLLTQTNCIDTAKIRKPNAQIGAHDWDMRPGASALELREMVNYHLRVCEQLCWLFDRVT